MRPPACGLFAAFVWLIFSSICTAQTSHFLPVDGERVGIKGVNLPWLDGAYGHDFGKSVEGWVPQYTREKAVARFSDISRMNANVMRVWVFQAASGVITDSEGYAEEVDPTFLRNLKEAISIADSKGVNCYLCLLSSVQEFSGKTGKDIVTDPKARTAFFQNVVSPFTTEMKRNPGVFAFDLANEPESSVYEDGGWSKKVHGGYTWEQMHSFLKEFAATVHNADPTRLVSVGSSGTYSFKQGHYLGLGLDFFDYHAYQDDGDLESARDIRRALAKSRRASRRELELPILIGECGQDAKNDDEIQRRAVAGFLKNAKSKGYAGALVWSYEWPGVDSSKEWDRLLKGDGDASWRPAAYEIQKFQWSDASASATSSRLPSQQVRFRLDIDAFGNCEVSVRKAEGPLAKVGGSGIERYGSARLPKTRIDRTKGLVRLVHDFSDADPVEKLSFRPHPSVVIDTRFKVLTLTSEPGKPAALGYGYRVALPMAVAFDEFHMPELSATRVRLDSNDGEALIVSLYREEKTDPKLYIASSWIDKTNNQRTQTLEPVPFELKTGISRKFRLPLPNAEITTPFWLSLIGDSQQKSVQEISSLLVQGDVKPSLGVAFDERAGLIYATRVFAGSIAADAGVEVGDVVTDFNGSEPTSAQNLVELIGKAKFGEVATLKILRAKRPFTISIKFE